MSYFQTLSVGDRLRFHFTPTEGGGWQQIDLRDSKDNAFPGFEFKGLVDYPDGYGDLVVTQDVYDRIMVNGILVRGAYFTLTKVELIQESSETPEPSNVIWEGEQEYGEWYDLYLDVSHFQNLVIGNKIRFHFVPDTGDVWPQMDLRDSTDQSFPGFEWKGLVDFPEGYADFEITQDVYDRIMAGGLHIRGSYYLLTKVELI